MGQNMFVIISKTYRLTPRPVQSLPNAYRRVFPQGKSVVGWNWPQNFIQYRD